MATSLCTDLRRVSSGTTGQKESLLTRSIRSSLDQQSPWLAAAEQLALFPTKRCVMMRPADWQELSGVLGSLNRQCAAVKTACSSRSTQPDRDHPSFVAALELLVQLGRVTSCLLCVNGDDRSFSIARVAQAIRTTTSVLEAVLAQAVPAGLSAEVADSLARQRCEQTPLLSAVTWALRQEARALFFNPRPTALSLGTALLDLFREVEQLWPLGIFVPQQHELSLDATAARMADPAAQLALAMLRCAGRAMADVGPGACRESLVCGLRVGYDMVRQISTLLANGNLSSHEGLVKQLQQSPSLPQLMLALLAVETHRLNQQLGVSETDSCILLQQQQDASSRRRSQRHSTSSAHVLADASTGPQEQQQQLGARLSATDSARLSRRCSSAAESPAAAVRGDSHQQDPEPAVPGMGLQRTLSQQRLLREQERQQQLQEEEEHQEIEGAGELHQVWHQVLGMARKNLARGQQADEQAQEQEAAPRSPLMKLWVSLGLPEGLLQLAVDAGVSPAAPAQQYMAVCRVGKFLLQGSPLLQPQHGPPQQVQRPASPAAVAAAAAPGIATQPSFSGAAAASAASNGQLSPFAGLSNQPPSRTQSQSYRASGALPQAWQSSSPGAAATGHPPVGTPLSTAYSLGDPFAGPVGSVGSLSPRDTLHPGGTTSVSAEAAEQLMEACRDTGLKGQEQLELLRLQRVVPVVLLNTAASLLQHHAAAAAAATPASAAAGGGGGGAAGFGQQGRGQDASCSSSSSSREPELVQVVHAACTAAACVSRCWPVLQKVAEQQEELVELLAECHPPAGVYAGLTTVCWRPYEVPHEVRLPVLQLLQLVVKLIWQLQPPWQQQPQQQQQPGHRQGESSPSPVAAPLLLAAQAQHGPLAPGRSSGGSSTTAAAAKPGAPGRPPQILSPVAGECLDSLLEVLTAASKLPWEGHHPHPGHDSSHASRGREHGPAGLQLGGSKALQDGVSGGLDDAASDSSSVLSVGDVDAALVADTWRQQCQPVAAAVEACLRTAGQVAAAADGALDWKPGGLHTTVTVSAAGAAAAGAGAPGALQQRSAQADGAAAAGAAPKVQRHPSAVALGSCLASLCAPFGRPGPLVAAAAAAQPGGPEQQQLFALYVSKLKVLLYNPSSKKASLIAMHPMEQTPIYIIQQLCAQGISSSTSPRHPSQHQPGPAAPAAPANGSSTDISAALLPWLLLLSRLMVLRGKLLGHLLATEGDESGRSGATSALHTAYWHIKMAHDSASTLAAHLTGALGCGPVAAEPLLALQQRQERARVQSELQVQLLPALKQAVQVLRAAMKLSRHYHETGFASGFAAGFAAGYAAAVAAASGGDARGPAAPGPVSFASPWGVLQQGCIRVLPQQLEAVGVGLAWQLRDVGCSSCSNPTCVNLSLGSELWLIPQASTSSTREAVLPAGDATGSSGAAAEAASNGSTCGTDAGGADAAADTAAGGALASGRVGLCCSCSKAAQGL